METYAPTSGEITVSLAAYNTTAHVVEIHNRRAKHPASTGHKLAFKQAEIVGSFYQHTLQHTYDTASRLTQSAYRNGIATTGTTFREYEFTYDIAGNRTNQTIKLNGVTNSNINYTYNLADQLTSDGVNTYGYDARGNLITINGSPAYTWDRANRLLSYGGSSYSYNGAGQRLSQTIGANTTQYLQDVQPALYKVLSATTGANTTRYIHDPIGIHSQENPDGSWNWMLKDGLGSVRYVVDNNANILASAQYAPYGEVWDGSVASQTASGFTGEFTDANGLVYLRARHFNPSLGIFPNLDPLETPNRYSYTDANPINGAVGEPVFSNGYAYATANPVNLVDPTGLIGERPPTCQNSLNSSFQDCGDCIAPPSGSIRFSPCGIKPEIDDMALYTKGILFTIGCGVTGTWDNVNKQAISDAINLIESKGINFLQTFGGLELRLVTDITASDSNPIAQTDRPRTSVIHFDPDWVTFAQGASTGDAVRNVIHELGHILDYRTRSIENGMFVAAVRTNDTIYSDSLIRKHLAIICKRFECK